MVEAIQSLPSVSGRLQSALLTFSSASTCPEMPLVAGEMLLEES